MSCSLNAFKNRFPKLVEGPNDISTNQEKNNILAWVKSANSQANVQGFTPKLFTITGTSQKTILNVNANNLALYNEYLDKEFYPQIELDMAFQRDLMNSKDENNLDDDVAEDFNIDQNSLSDAEYHSVLHSTLTNEDDNFDEDPYDEPYEFNGEDFQDIEDPINFREWRSTLEMMKKRLIEKKKALLARGNKSNIVELNATIEQIEKDIANFDERNALVVLRTVRYQIDSMTEVLKSNTHTVEDLANIIQTNLFKERIEKLQEAFSKDRSDVDTSLYTMFNTGFDNMDEMAGKVDNLMNLYNKSLSKIMQGVVESNDYVRGVVERLTLEGQIEKRDSFLKAIKDYFAAENSVRDRDGDGFFGKNFLGMASYNSVIANALAMARDVAEAKEAGITNILKKNLEVGYNKLKHLTENGEPFPEQMFEKDMFGQNKGNLIKPFTDVFENDKEVIKSAEREFYLQGLDSQERFQAYKDWMETLKSKADFIEVQKIASFARTFQSEPKFSSYLKYSQSEMASYEQEMRDKMGDIAFELELEKQINGAENYLVDEFKSHREAAKRNPLAFLEHFYSPEFSGSDQYGELPILNSTYVSMMPKTSNPDYFNQTFKDLESRKVDGFKEFYMAAKKLEDYGLEAELAAGNTPRGNGILNLEDSTNSAIMQDLGFFGKTQKYAQALVQSNQRVFYEGSVEPDNDVRKFNSKLFDPVNSAYRKFYDIYRNQSYAKMRQTAIDEGLIDNSQYPKQNDYTRRILAEGLALKMVNKNASMNIFKRIMHGTSLAESSNSRLTTLSLSSIARDYAAHSGLQNTDSFLEGMEAINIKQVGSLRYGGVRDVQNIKMKKFLGANTKMYSEMEKVLKSVLEEELKNLSGNSYSFSVTDKETDTITSYFNKDGVQYKKVGENPEEPADLPKVREVYEGYLAAKLDELGKHPTIGSIFQGFAWNMFEKYMLLKPLSGVRNRIQGMTRNNQTAVSGRDGYDTEDLWSARKFMTGMGLHTMINFLPGKGNRISNAFGPKSVAKQKQWKALMHVVQGLGLVQNVQSDINSPDSDTAAMTGSDVIKKIKEVAVAPSMTLPELYNQLETLIAIMHNQKIEKFNPDGTISDEKVPLFDKKTMTLPFNTETMELLPPYNTPNNIANWVNFKADANGRSANNDLVQKYSAVRDKNNGNYRTNDKNLFQGSMGGRSATAFMKWYYEDLNSQYGKKKIDLIRGETQVKGRKLVLLTRVPVLTSHLLMNNIGIGAIGATAYGLFAGSTSLGLLGNGILLAFVGSAVGAGTIAAGTLWLTYHMYQNRKDMTFAKQDVKMAFAYFAEVVLRLAKTTALSWSRGNVNIASDVKIREMLGHTKNKWKNTGTTLEERMQISENAQELADKYNLYMNYAILQLTLKGAMMLLQALAGDDDDEETINRRADRLASLDAKMNFLINERDKNTNDILRNTDISQTLETAQTSALAQFLVNSWNGFVMTPYRVANGDLTPKEGTFKIIDAFTGAAFGTPSAAIDAFNTDNPYFEDKSLYPHVNKTVFDDYMRASLKQGDGKFEELVKQRKKSARPTLERDIKRRLLKEFKDQGMARPDEEELRKIINKNIQKVYENKNMKKAPGKGSYEEILEQGKWDELESGGKESDLILSSKTPAKSTTKSNSRGSSRGGSRGGSKSSSKSRTGER